LLGGRFVSGDTLLRFYVLHCVAIPLVVAVLIAVHFWRVRKDGGISGALLATVAIAADNGTNSMHASMTPGFQFGLAVFYLICAGMNVGFARSAANDRSRRNAWGLVALLFLVHAMIYATTAAVAPKYGPLVPEALVKL